MYLIIVTVILIILFVMKKSYIFTGGAPSKVIIKEKIPKKITWKEKINDWKNGTNIPKINTNIMFETSPIDFTKNNWGIYKEKQVKIDTLNKNTLPNTTSFKDYLKKDKFVVFDNLDNQCRLICPPNDGKNYSHISNFYLNANNNLIKALWKKVALEVEDISKKNKWKKIWVSTHGLSVSFLHIRVCNKPKYYKTLNFTH